MTLERQHPRHRLDSLISHPVRFSILATLAKVDEATFAAVRDSLLSKQVSALEAANYLKVRKGYVGKWPRTWLALSTGGRDAYRQHLDALREIAGP